MCWGVGGKMWGEVWAEACPAINEWGGEISDNFLLLLDTAAAVTYSQSLLKKGQGQAGELRGAVANHYEILNLVAR